MNLSDQEQEQLSIGNIQMDEAPLVLPFEAIKSELIPLVGGKAANLGEMIQAGLPVPPGFCVTTTAYKRIAQGAHLDALLDELAVTPSSDSRHAHIIAEIRSFLLDVPMPDEVANAIAVAYQALGQGAMVAVAVRSSATAEDLPFASFAGQQETYLNIVGIEAILKAVSRCWASLWTDRSVSYRESLDIDSRTVQLAVVIQQLVDVSVAGVLFTANPLTGHRAQAVIDASPGLGEAVVSGAVNPDHFVVSRPIGEIIERRPGDKRVIIQAKKEGGTERIDLPVSDTRSCLSDQQIRALTALGAQVETHYGAPQDIEWAIDTSGKFWLTQTRAITTLYPLPSDAPTKKDSLRVYFSVNVAQGVYRPLTPMGLGMFHLLASSIATFIGLPPRDLLAGPAPLKDAGMRLFVDVTPALRSRAGRKLVIRAMQAMESRTARIFQYLAHDSRLSFLPASDFRLLRTFLFVMVRSRLPLHIAMALFKPANARRHLDKMRLDLQAQTTLADGTSAVERVATVERLLFETMPRVFVGIIPTMLGALGAYSFASKLLVGLASDDERQVVLRALPYNPTTEMDLKLWALAQKIKTNEEAVQAVQTLSANQLLQAYRQGNLPATLQQGLAEFLSEYGQRSVAEIDIGMPRWSEDPGHILGMLANYLNLTNPELAPDKQFERGAQEGEAMVQELTRRARRKGFLRGMLVGWSLRRTRALVGLREAPKFYLVTMLARVRMILFPVGEELVQLGRISKAADIFFLNLQEAYEALAGRDFRDIVQERQITYTREVKRRQIPRVLLSDGTEPVGESVVATSMDGTLQGTPASSGIVTASARVIIEPDGARLEPGEILVAPSTDPGWTPLFLTAGGLVMEMGGAMSHGAVVAREYGIPAVVGVPGAIERIRTGQMICIDGSQGTVSIVHPA